MKPTHVWGYCFEKTMHETNPCLGLLFLKQHIGILILQHGFCNMSNPKKQQTNNVVLFLNLKNKLHQYISGVALWLSKALHFDNYAEQICFGLLLIVIKSTKKIELHISTSYSRV